MGAPPQARSRGPGRRAMDSRGTRDMELLRDSGGISRPKARDAEADDQDPVGPSAYEFANERAIHHGTSALGSPSLRGTVLAEGIAARIAVAALAGSGNDAEKPNVDP